MRYFSEISMWYPTAKGVGVQKAREGSNPSHSATEEPPDGGFSVFGEMSERFKELVLKTSDGATHRGFESHSLRQICPNELL